MTDRLLAALMFFTRLPFWRVKRVDSACFKHVVDYWPFAGWLTGGTMALVYWLAAGWFPGSVVALLAVGARILLTGALHEARVFITPGFIFGSNGKRYIRISLCAKKEKLAEALKRIQTVFKH